MAKQILKNIAQCCERKTTQQHQNNFSGAGDPEFSFLGHFSGWALIEEVSPVYSSLYFALLKVESSGRSRFFFSFSMRSVYNSPSSWRTDKLEISSFTGTILLYYFPDMENNKANNCCSLLRVNMCHLCDMSQLHCFRKWEAGSKAELNH